MLFVVVVEKYLHAILALDPASNMCSPSKRAAKSLNNIVPLNPRSILNSTRLSEEKSSLNAGIDAHSKRNHGDDGEKSGGHLGHDRSKDLGWGVFSFPGHVLSHKEGGGLGLDLGGEGPLGEGSLLDGGGKCR